VPPILHLEESKTNYFLKVHFNQPSAQAPVTFIGSISMRNEELKFDFSEALA